MAMMDQADLEKLVDFSRLKKSNDLLLKWGNRLGVCKNRFVRWAIGAMKNPEAQKKLLPVVMRSAFAKDCKSMFYASEVQSILVEQYEQMIHKILKYIYITQDKEIYQDFYNEGMIAIMYATWSYRTVKNKCNFTTFCYNTLFMRLRGMKNKDYRKQQRRTSKKMIYTECDQGENFSLADYAEKDNSDQYSLIEPIDIVLEKLISAANLNEADAFLIKAYTNRKERLEKGVWYHDFQQKFTHTFKHNRITKQGLQQRVKKLHAKLWFHYKKMYGGGYEIGMAS